MVILQNFCENIYLLIKELLKNLESINVEKDSKIKNLNNLSQNY